MHSYRKGTRLHCNMYVTLLQSMEHVSTKLRYMYLYYTIYVHSACVQNMFSLTIMRNLRIYKYVIVYNMVLTLSIHSVYSVRT